MDVMVVNVNYLKHSWRKGRDKETKRQRDKETKRQRDMERVHSKRGGWHKKEGNAKREEEDRLRF